MSYPFSEIEPKWQEYWERENTFKTDINTSKPKYYCLDMFPYPSGAGLHVGHPEGYTATDIISRFRRMKGYEVLHPMGWDAFGLPAERYAMTTGIHPRETTEKNIDNFRRQIKMLGLSYDWSRELSTTDSGYYKFTQWIFLTIYNSWFNPFSKKAEPVEKLKELFRKEGSASFTEFPAGHFTPDEWSAMNEADQEKTLSEFRLVYLANIPVNWCEELGTVLANEEVEEWTGKGYTVERRPMKQYMMRITAYAERLLDDLSLVSWPPSTLEMQKNWIGKSEGVELSFPVGNHPVRVYTTRPDTIFGVTYLVLAPEHPLVDEITTDAQRAEMDKYRREASLKSELDRTELSKDKTGVFTGSYASNPADPDIKIPVWVSDYVLFGYGTGAIMAVPAHDQRDYEFARAFNLEIKQVIAGEMKDEAFDSKESVCINSAGKKISINDLSYRDAFEKMASWAEKENIGKRKTQYKLRDWLFARQRYWGEPIPLYHTEDGIAREIPFSELPLKLPDLKEFKPSGTGESPLALAEEWLNYEHNGLKGRRETNTMPQWAGSCWYYLRFIDPDNTDRLCDPELEKKWMPVDLYVGGAEHAVLHLLYSRFWHKILFDLGHVSTPEPFLKLVHQGLILGEDKRKMSKSLGNVVNPDDVVREYGADSLRLFEMFMGPFEMVKPWSTKGAEGIFRFLSRVWRLFHERDTFRVDEVEPDEFELKTLHKTVKKVTEDIDNFSFNTAISQMMIFVNEINPRDRRPRKILEPFVLLLSPFAPHIAEELWNRLGHNDTLAREQFPVYEEKYTIDDTVKIMVQVNGKLRGELETAKGISKEEALALAKKLDKVSSFLEGKTVKKEIFVPDKIVNFVAV